jgi:hypothetical protein
MANGYANGHLKDLVTGKPIVADVGVAVAPLKVQQGFLRDANYAIVTETALTTRTVACGYAREAAAGTNNYAVLAVAAGSAVAPLTNSHGLTRDANLALVV